MKIAIDGPAGAGKSTVAKELSEKLDFDYLDTGAMYRAAAYYMLKNNIDLYDEEKVNDKLKSLNMEVLFDDGNQHTIVNGEDVTKFIRTDDISQGASAIGTNKQVRQKLVELQRKIAGNYNIIMDGRDIGSYVLPDADYKFYITAEPEERARRRFIQNGKESILTLEEIEEEIKKRDFNDMHREFAPLKRADDAILIDTTNLTAQETIDKIVGIVKGA